MDDLGGLPPISGNLHLKHIKTIAVNNGFLQGPASFKLSRRPLEGADLLGGRGREHVNLPT